jgi:hypothetical protein
MAQPADAERAPAWLKTVNRSRPMGRRSRVGSLPVQDAKAIDYLSADGVARLGPISYSAINSPLRQALRSFSQALRVAIVVDRRVDPDQLVDLDLRNVPLLDALKQIAARADAGATILGPIAYIGPLDTAAQLRTLAALATEDAKRLPARQKNAALASRTLAWQALTTPQQVFEQLSREAGIKIGGLDKLPHDLLAATDLPPLPWIDRVTLVAAQFGLRAAYDAATNALMLEPIRPDEVHIERSYPAGRDPSKTVAEWQKKAPQAEIKLSGARIGVRATIEDHELLSPTHVARPSVATPGQQVYTLTLEGMKLETFLAQLEQKLSLSFDLAPDVKLDALVNVDVKNATLDDLLRAAFGPLGLEFSRKGNAVLVRPKGG